MPLQGNYWVHIFSWINAVHNQTSAFLGVWVFKFLMPTCVPSLHVVLSKLQALPTAVDNSLLSRCQKLLLYSTGGCSRLTWPLLDLIQEFPIIWGENEADSMATQYLKRWAGLCKSSNIAILCLPRAMDGLNFPCLQHSTRCYECLGKASLSSSSFNTPQVAKSVLTEPAFNIMGFLCLFSCKSQPEEWV